MIEDNKYYVPQIGEFHEGFEYEQYIPGSGNDYQKIVFSLSDSNFVANCYSQNLQAGWIRVKYLDKDNIESEGFKYDKKREEYISDKTYLGCSTGDDKKLMICHEEDDHYTHIYYKSNRGEEFTKFEGFIKNKSKFKEILKMTIL
jgi:hypothetical protein